MKKFLKPFMLMMALVAMFTIVSCDKEEDVKFELLTFKSGDIDLNGASAATGVSTEPTLVMTFSKDIDVTGLTVTMKQVYDNAVVVVTKDVTAKVVTLTVPKLASGTSYELTVSGLKSKDGEMFDPITRSFTTAGGFVPTGQVAYWPFNGNTNDEQGAYDPTASQVVAITYGADRKGGANGAAVFNGDNSIVEVSGADALINTANFTVSFWVKTNSDHLNADGNPTGHFVFGLGAFYGIQYEIFGGYDGSKFAIQYAMADNKTGAEDMWFPALATDNTTGGWQGWDYAKSLTAEQMMAKLKDNWVHIVYTYSGADRKGTIYFDGVKMKSFDFDLWPDGDAKRAVSGMKWGGAAPDVVNELAFGFVQSRAGTMWDAEGWGGYDFATSNHFKGSLDEFRIFHKALSAQEVDLLYKSEKGN